MNADYYFERGCEYMNSQEFEMAIREFSNSINLREDGASYENRAMAKSFCNDKLGAIEDFEKSIAISKMNLQNNNLNQKLVKRDICATLFNLAYNRVALNDFENALENLKECLLFFPTKEPHLMPYQLEEINLLKDQCESRLMSYISKTFIWANRNINITVEKILENRVSHSKFRASRPFPVTVNSDTNEFFTDIQRMFAVLRSDNFGEVAISDMLLMLCNEHIGKYGRLVDVDIETYLDESLIIYDAINFSLNKNYIAENTGIQIRDRLKDRIILNHYDSIWINKADFGIPNLVKLSDAVAEFNKNKFSSR